MVLDGDFNTDERVRNEADILFDAGHDVSVMHYEYSSSSTVNGKHKRIKTIPLGKNKKWRNKWYFFSSITSNFFRFWASKIQDEVDINNYDVVHFHDLYMWKAALKLNNRNKFKTVLDLHENYPYAIYGYKWATKFPNFLIVQPWRWKSFAKKHLSEANRIIVLSKAYKSRLLQKYPSLQEQQMFVYPNIPNVNKLLNFPVKKDIIPKTQNDFYIFYFGGISKRRGIFTSINAMNYVGQLKYNVKLLLIGPVDKSEKQEFNRAISAPSVKSKIVYIPWINFQELPSYLNVVDICISPIIKNPQHESGVANKVFQYMLFEKPIIVSNCRPQTEIVEHEKCGLVFKSEDERDLADKIDLLIDNDGLRRQMGENGKKAIKEKYNTQVFGKQLVKLYTSLENEKNNK